MAPAPQGSPPGLRRGPQGQEQKGPLARGRDEAAGRGRRSHWPLQPQEQGVDPRQANIDWQGFRDHQREPAREAVASAIVLDEVARREQVGVESGELEAEIDRYAAATGRTSDEVRTRLEKEGGISRLYMGLRREKAVDLVRSRATIVEG